MGIWAAVHVLDYFSGTSSFKLHARCASACDYLEPNVFEGKYHAHPRISLAVCRQIIVLLRRLLTLDARCSLNGTILLRVMVLPAALSLNDATLR
jgi:hypothetical protein